MCDPNPDNRCICGDPALSATDLIGRPAIETTGYGVGLATTCDATGDVVAAGGDGATDGLGATDEVGATDRGAGSIPQPQTATAASTVIAVLRPLQSGTASAALAGYHHTVSSRCSASNTHGN